VAIVIFIPCLLGILAGAILDITIPGIAVAIALFYTTTQKGRKEILEK